MWADSTVSGGGSILPGADADQPESVRYRYASCARELTCGFTSARATPKPSVARLHQAQGLHISPFSWNRDPNFRYNAGTTNMLSKVEVTKPQRITIAIGV